jgi:hypothetical protein
MHFHSPVNKYNDADNGRDHFLMWTTAECHYVVMDASTTSVEPCKNWVMKFKTNQ